MTIENSNTILAREKHCFNLGMRFATSYRMNNTKNALVILCTLAACTGQNSSDASTADKEDENENISTHLNPSENWRDDLDCDRAPLWDFNPGSLPVDAFVDDWIGDRVAATCGCGGYFTINRSGEGDLYSNGNLSSNDDACLCDTLASLTQGELESPVIYRSGQGQAVGPCASYVIIEPARESIAFTACDDLGMVTMEVVEVSINDCVDGSWIGLDNIARNSEVVEIPCTGPSKLACKD